MQRRAQIASASRCGASSAGARVTRRMPSRWTFSPTGQNRVSPSRPRTPTIESSRSNATTSSASSSSADRLERRDATLALPVVAEAPRLDDRRQPGLLEAAEAGGRDPQRAEELLLAQPVLAVLERRDPGDRARAHGRLDGDVLELVRDDVRAAGEAARARPRPRTRRRRAPRPPRAGVGRGVEEAEARPSGSPASPSIRPSCPPPMQATSVIPW